MHDRAGRRRRARAPSRWRLGAGSGRRRRRHGRHRRRRDGARATHEAGEHGHEHREHAASAQIEQASSHARRSEGGAGSVRRRCCSWAVRRGIQASVAGRSPAADRARAKPSARARRTRRSSLPSGYGHSAQEPSHRDLAPCLLPRRASCSALARRARRRGARRTAPRGQQPRRAPPRRADRRACRAARSAAPLPGARAARASPRAAALARPAARLVRRAARRPRTLSAGHDLGHRAAVRVARRDRDRAAHARATCGAWRASPPGAERYLNRGPAPAARLLALPGRPRSRTPRRGSTTTAGGASRS